MGCHRKIDPWGIAFEEYDAVGNLQRDGVGATLRKRQTSQPIDAKAKLPTGVKVDGMRELRSELLRPPQAWRPSDCRSPCRGSKPWRTPSHGDRKPSGEDNGTILLVQKTRGPCQRLWPRFLVVTGVL